MFDIGAMELFVVAVIALVVVGPKELPRLLKTIAGFVRKARELTHEFRMGVENLAEEAERELDPFNELRKEEGLRPGMSPEEVTEHIMANRERDKKVVKAVNSDDQPEPEKTETPKPGANKTEVKSDTGGDA